MVGDSVSRSSGAVDVHHTQPGQLLALLDGTVNAVSPCTGSHIASAGASTITAANYCRRLWGGDLWVFCAGNKQPDHTYLTSPGVACGAQRRREAVREGGRDQL